MGDQDASSAKIQSECRFEFWIRNSNFWYDAVNNWYPASKKVAALPLAFDVEGRKN
jgi:hypothetical protein